MKKILVLNIVIFLMILTSCSFPSDDEIIISDEPKELDNIDIIEDDKKRIVLIDDVEYDLDHLDIKMIKKEHLPFLVVEKMYYLDSYLKITTGKTKAKLIINYTQDIDSKVYKYDNSCYLLTKSTSPLVKVYHEAFIKDNDVLYKTHEANDFIPCSIDEYLNTYGINPLNKNIEGFIINQDTIISSSITNDNEQFLLTLELDGNASGNNNKIQMKTYGNLVNYPDFKTLTLVIALKSDLSPISINLSSTYEVKYPVLGNALCNQEYLVTFKDLSISDISQIEFFKQ